MEIDEAMYLALALMLLSQLLVLRVPESKPKVPGGPSFLSLLGSAVDTARAEMWAGFRDQEMRWRAGEKLLNDLTVFLFLLLGGLTVHLVTLFNVFQYKLDPSVEERIEFGFVLIAPFVLGVFAWVRHFKQGDKAEIYAMPHYLYALAVACFAAAFVNSFFGYLLCLAVVMFALPAATIPVGAMWASQAPINRQGRFAGVSVVILVVAVGFPFVALSLVGFMTLTGRWAPLPRYHRGSHAAKNDLRPAAPMVLGALMLFAAARKMRAVAFQVHKLASDRKRDDAEKRDLYDARHVASFTDAAGKTTDAHAADFFHRCASASDSDSDDDHHHQHHQHGRDERKTPDDVKVEVHQRPSVESVDVQPVLVDEPFESDV